MANKLPSDGVRVIALDTAGSTSAYNDLVRIIGFVWDSGDSGAVGDNVVLHDALSGNVVFQATLAVAKDTIHFAPAESFDVKGLYLTTLDRGILLIYYK